MRRRTLIPVCEFLLAAAVAAPLSSCKKAEHSPATVSNEPAAASTAAAGAPSAVRVTDLELGKSLKADKTVEKAGDVFAPGDTIFLSVLTDGSAPSATIKTTWTYQDGQTVKSDSRTITPNGSSRTEFSIQKPGGWPKGGYKVDVSIDGGSAAATKSFRVE